MRLFKLPLLCIAATLLTATVAPAENLPLDIYNFLRIEYDDNVFTINDELGDGAVDSAVIIEQIEFLLDSQQGNTYYGLRYSPSYHYYDDRPADDDDLNHEWDLILEQDFSPRTTGQIKHTLRVSEESELVEEDVTFRGDNDYMYNSVVASLTTQVAPETTSVRVLGDFSDFSYDKDDVADANDYQKLGAVLELIQVLNPNSNLTGSLGYRELDYESDFRDSEVIRISASYAKTFSPKLQGVFGLGWEQQNSDDPNTEDLDSPYADVRIVYSAARSTNVSIGGSYGIDRSPVNTFSAQERARMFARVSHDITAAVNFIFQGSVAMGDFDEDSATSLFNPELNSDGDEETIQLLTAFNYELNARNSLELAWRYTELDSDVRPGNDYDRNRYSLGWKYRL